MKKYIKLIVSILFVLINTSSFAMNKKYDKNLSISSIIENIENIPSEMLVNMTSFQEELQKEKISEELKELFKQMDTEHFRYLLNKLYEKNIAEKISLPVLVFLAEEYPIKFRSFFNQNFSHIVSFQKELQKEEISEELKILLSTISLADIKILFENLPLIVLERMSFDVLIYILETDISKFNKMIESQRVFQYITISDGKKCVNLLKKMKEKNINKDIINFLITKLFSEASLDNLNSFISSAEDIVQSNIFKMPRFQKALQCEISQDIKVTFDNISKSDTLSFKFLNTLPLRVIKGIGLDQLAYLAEINPEKFKIITSEKIAAIVSLQNAIKKIALQENNEKIQAIINAMSVDQIKAIKLIKDVKDHIEYLNRYVRVKKLSGSVINNLLKKLNI